MIVCRILIARRESKYLSICHSFEITLSRLELKRDKALFMHQTTSPAGLLGALLPEPELRALAERSYLHSSFLEVALALERCYAAHHPRGGVLCLH